MFVPLNLGRNHWTLLALDSRLRSRCTVFWDPLGYRCPKEIWSKLTKFFIGFTLADLQSRVQYDGFQCGVWACWGVETLTSLALDGKDWDRDTFWVRLTIFFMVLLRTAYIILFLMQSAIRLA